MIVDQVRLRIWELVQERQAEIVWAAAADWPTALGYAPWVEKVWANDLGNAQARRAAPPHRVSANIQAEGRARFWVRDNGPGAAPGDQAKLFIPFTYLAPTLQ
jgi:signal transduction histidine kinase